MNLNEYQQRQIKIDEGVYKTHEEASQKMQHEYVKYPEKLNIPSEIEGIKNTSGLQPIEFKVLIKPDDVSDTDPVLKKAKESGFILAPSEHEEAAQVKGTVIAVGGRAFHDFGDPSPKVGDRIYFAKYSGLVIAGDDGQEYRLMNDKDVAAIVNIAEVAA